MGISAIKIRWYRNLKNTAAFAAVFLLAKGFQLFIDLCQLFGTQTSLGEGTELAEGQRTNQLHLGIRLKAGGILGNDVAGSFALS